MSRFSKYERAVFNSKAKNGFSVYGAMGQVLYSHHLAAMCHNYIRDNNLKNARVGYAK